MLLPRVLKFSAFATVFLAAMFVEASAVFPDVPEGSPFRASIEMLVDAGVVNGNPDGTFRPENDVNRAEMLKMLYKATGKIPDPLSIKCFPDVAGWYESFVCDAALRRYVNGYADGTFRPGNPVNRVEAIKMIATVFEMPLDEVTDDSREIVNFGDVSLAAWYTQYLLTVYNNGVMPFPGQEGGRFYPERPLKRKEAAAMIYNALKVDFKESRQARSTRSASAASTSFSSMSMSEATEGTQEGDDTVSGTIDVTFPFTKEGKFNVKNPVSYRFAVVTPQVVHVTVSLQSGQPGEVSCRLYLLDESGFSDQYFLGYQEGGSCYLRSALNTGTYQLQLQPTQANTTFSASVQKGSGDGNDGFREAKSVSVNAEHTDTLTAYDFEDWYKFSLTSLQHMTISLQNPAELRCIVYAMNDVNLASFSGPQCNEVYDFPQGTYYIAVGRKAPKGSQQSYTVELQK